MFSDTLRFFTLWTVLGDHFSLFDLVNHSCRIIVDTLDCFTVSRVGDNIETICTGSYSQNFCITLTLLIELYKFLYWSVQTPRLNFRGFDKLLDLLTLFNFRNIWVQVRNYVRWKFMTTTTKVFTETIPPPQNSFTPTKTFLENISSTDYKPYMIRPMISFEILTVFLICWN